MIAQGLKLHKTIVYLCWWYTKCTKIKLNAASKRTTHTSATDSDLPAGKSDISILTFFNRRGSRKVCNIFMANLCKRILQSWSTAYPKLKTCLSYNHKTDTFHLLPIIVLLVLVMGKKGVIAKVKVCKFAKVLWEINLCDILISS